MTANAEHERLREAAVEAVKEKRLRSMETLQGGPLRHIARRSPRNLVKGGIFMAGSMLASRGFSLSGLDASAPWKLLLGSVLMAVVLGGLEYAYTPLPGKTDPQPEADQLIEAWRRITAPWWPALIAAGGTAFGVLTVFLEAWAEETAVDPGSLALGAVGATVFFVLVHVYTLYTHPLAGVGDESDRLPSAPDEAVHP